MASLLLVRRRSSFRLHLRPLAAAGSPRLLGIFSWKARTSCNPSVAARPSGTLPRLIEDDNEPHRATAPV